jgi:hypothetical protein
MKKSIFKSVAVIIFTLFLLLLTPIIPSHISQALTTDIPATPTGVTAASSSYNSINISWKGVTGATLYGIYRASSNAGTYTLISTTTATKYNNVGLTTNSTYYYKIRSYRIIGLVKVFSGLSSVVSTKPIPSPPTSVKAVGSSYNSINISWSGVAGATAYEIYRATSSAGTYTIIAGPAANMYKNIGLTINSTYYYKVRAYRLASNVKVYSGFSTTISSKPIATPTSQPISYTYGNTSGNLTNGGSAVSDGQYIYYLNSSDGYKLYKSKPDGSLKSKINDSRCGSLNIVGDWIYYTGSFENEGIYKMKKDGSSKTLIVKSQVMGISVVNDWIYYLERDASQSQKNDLYKIKTNGTSKTKINFGAGSSLVCAYLQDIVVVENWVYLSLYNKVENKEQLFRIKTDGSSAQKVLSSSPRFFSIEGGWVYYADETYKKINKAKVDGSSEKVIYTIPESHYSLYSINISNGYVYFSNYTESQPTDKLGIYRMKTDGTNTVKLVSGSAKFLNIVSDWIYFESPGSASPTYSNGVFKIIIGGSSQILKLKTDGSQLLKAN